MKNCLLLAILFCSLAVAKAQVAQDKANKGQLKRMVYEQWNDWQPSPDWHKVFGVPVYPKSALGWAYWGILHRSYWKGEDKRPYKKGGQFDVNYASLVMQATDDKRIMDSMKYVMTNVLKKFASEGGGELDLPWTMYFGKIFDELETEIPDQFPEFQLRRPRAYSEFTQSLYWRSYKEFVEIERSSLESIHTSISDRGSKINQYLKIKMEWEQMNKEANSRIAALLSATMNLPDLKSAAPVKSIDSANSDAELVQKILSRGLF